MNAHRLPLTLCRQNESANSQKPRKPAEQMGEVQKPNKLAEQIGEVGRIRPPIWGGGVGGLVSAPAVHHQPQGACNK